MIHFVMTAATEAALRAFLAAYGLRRDANTPVQFADYCLWAGRGKLLVSADPETYASGVYALGSISLPGDEIPEGQTQFDRSLKLKAIKAADAVEAIVLPGLVGTLDCVRVGAVKIIDTAQFEAWLSANSLPRHEWSGGNSF
jgi:hypothetical protein